MMKTAGRFGVCVASWILFILLLRIQCVWSIPMLVLSSVVYRHGDRSPVGTFPTDRYKEEDWPQGYGQLSIEGMRQQHLLGELLKERYIISSDPALVNFMNENYTREQIYVQSTDVDRTLMSAESQLSGLFPPNDDERFNESIAWQPIPVHTVKKDEDILLRGHDVYCPTYTQLKEADKETEEYRAIEEENKDFFLLLAEESGFSTVDLSNIWTIQDTVFIEEFFAQLANFTGLDSVDLSTISHIWSSVFIENVTDGKSPPEWATDDVIHQLNNLSDFTMTLLFNSKGKSRITAGMWLQKVLSDMKGKAAGGNETLEKMKLFLYSAHDTTVAAMASALGVFDKKQPSYASALFVELYQDEETYYVQLFYRKGPYSEEINLLSFPEGTCQVSTQCTLDEFEQFVTPLIPDNFQEECGISSDGQSTVPMSIVILLGGLLAVVTVSLMVVCLLLVMVCCSKKSSRYSQLEFTAGQESA